MTKFSMALYVTMGSVICMSSFCAQHAFWTDLVSKPATISEMCAASLACLATYSFDRIASREDANNDKFRVVMKNSQSVYAFIIEAIAFMIASVAFAPRIAFNALVALPFGLLYCTAGEYVKRLFFASKNVYVVAMWNAWFFGATGAFPPVTARECTVVALYSAHVFLSNVIMDVKDIAQDRLNAVPTLPAFLGARASARFVRIYMGSLAVLSYAVHPPLSVAYVLLGGMLCAIDLTRGEHATAFVTNMMMVPTVVDHCAQRDFFLPFLFAIVMVPLNVQTVVWTAVAKDRT